MMPTHAAYGLPDSGVKTYSTEPLDTKQLASNAEDTFPLPPRTPPRYMTKLCAVVFNVFAAL